MNSFVHAQLDQQLAPEHRKPLFLRFPSELETQFEKEERRAKTREALLISLIALVLFDLFLFSDYQMNPSGLHRFLFIRLGIFTPCALVSMAATARWPVRAVRESLKTVVSSIAGACVLFVSVDTNGITSAISQSGLILCLVFALLILRLSFPYALVGAIVMTLEEIVFIRLDPWLHGPQQTTCIFLIVTSAVLSLVTNRRMEDAERRSYLLLLREELQGKRLATLNEELAELSNVDGLTGLANRRCFNDRIEKVWQQSGLTSTPVSIVMIDIDAFKHLNDTFGHLVGDQVLIALARVLLSAVRGGVDAVARFGGEEFVIILPGMDEVQAFQVAERIRLHVRETNLRPTSGSHAPAITISCGVATGRPRMGQNPTPLLEEADQALYKAKREGRDRVCISAQRGCMDSSAGRPQTEG